ncbi:rRNA-processing protein utp23 [Cytospora mali]|uniref:U three protein 23 n=1 Tax=Cytospora mali TaxID=578113 RepID=A0A194VVC2_CYTMA|nr:rRNA-processing protein utp23 [Valsa mali]
MRRLFLPSPASIPHQLRQALLRSGLHARHLSPCLTSSRLERERSRPISSSSSDLASATTPALGSDSGKPYASRLDDHEHYRQHDDDRTRPVSLPKLPYKFETGISLFAKRTPRPFPPPFLSPPSGSFSDPLSTHHQSRDRRPKVNGELIKGWTNGDDAAFASDYLICANDGVGAWTSRPRGHAGLWARLILHFWATSMYQDAARTRGPGDPPYVPDPIAYLQKAYEQTVQATAGPDWQGTTTATGAQLFYKLHDEAELAQNGATAERDGAVPILYVTNVGDSQVMVVRPSSGELVYKTTEQWHWFDCPRQLGTNSPDTPMQNAVMEKVLIKEGDVVLAMSDGVIDNLWSHEIVEIVSKSVQRWQSGEAGARLRSSVNTNGGGVMAFAAEELMLAAKKIALDPFAESPFMERAIEEGLPSEGGCFAIAICTTFLTTEAVTSATTLRIRKKLHFTYEGLCNLTPICRHKTAPRLPQLASPKMRGKRSKAYRKLLKQFELAFGFRQPYQVLVDADLVSDAHRCAMDLPQYLSNTLHGEVKILITQCSMRHLYARNKEPGVDRIIEKAKDYERRRCGHHPEEYPEPCSTLDCLGSVVGATNKHRYVVASQDLEVRSRMRGIPGVPLIYINRSVMILEPMAGATNRVVQKGERAKFRAELKEPATAGGKRKRDKDEDDSDSEDGEKNDKEEKPKKKKAKGGPKGPNPLAVKKPKKKKSEQKQSTKPREEKPTEDGSSEQPAKKKRKRKNKNKEGGEDSGAQDAAAVAADE